MPEDEVPEETERWKIILAALLPLLGVTLAGVIFCWYRQLRHRANRTSDIERIGTVLEDFRTKAADVQALSHELHTSMERVKKLETELKVRYINWST